MQSVSSRIWTCVAVSISYDDSQYSFLVIWQCLITCLSFCDYSFCKFFHTSFKWCFFFVFVFFFVFCLFVFFFCFLLLMLFFEVRVSMTFFGILAYLKSVVVRMILIHSLNSNSSGLLLKHLKADPRASTIIGITITFRSHIFFGSPAIFKYWVSQYTWGPCDC